jgi:hypothetical protein
MAATVVGFGCAAVLAPEWHDRLASPYALAILVLPALDAALLVIAVRVLVLPGDRLFVSRAVVLAVSYLLGAHLAAAMGTFSGCRCPMVWCASSSCVRSRSGPPARWTPACGGWPIRWQKTRRRSARFTSF